MNVRIALHVINAIAGAIAGGTFVLAGLSDGASQNIVAIAGLVVIGVSAYMAATTSGAAKS